MTHEPEKSASGTPGALSSPHGSKSEGADADALETARLVFIALTHGLSRSTRYALELIAAYKERRGERLDEAMKRLLENRSKG